MTMEALIARVEGASGPDRDLDGEIARLLGLNPAWANIQYERQKSLFGDGRAGLHAKTWLAPKFTASLDAAMSLVPPDLRVALVQKPDTSWACALLALTGDNRECPESAGGLASLALCAAALKARAATMGGSDE